MEGKTLSEPRLLETDWKLGLISTKAERVMDSKIDARDYFLAIVYSSRLAFFMFICLTLAVACEFRTKIDVMLI
jgi:hypothetical protein